MSKLSDLSGRMWLRMFGAISVAIGIFAAAHAKPEWQGPILITVSFVAVVGGLVSMVVRERIVANDKKDAVAARKAMLTDFCGPTKPKPKK